MKAISWAFTLISASIFVSLGEAETPPNRVASIYVSESLINEQLAVHLKSQMLKELKVELVPKQSKIFLHGILQVPVQELQAINLNPEYGSFKFQLTVKPEVNENGDFILEFPLNETFFYPFNSKDPLHDRIIVPVQMLSIALASVRGYLSALSGDFSEFDRRSEKLKIEINELKHDLLKEHDSNKKELIKNQLKLAHFQFDAIPVERKQLEAIAKDLVHILGFTGEKELNLNNHLAARKNTLILKLKLSQFAPYLDNVTLGGLRIRRDEKDGTPENYLAIDINSSFNSTIQRGAQLPVARPVMKKPPLLVVRLNQPLFDSKALETVKKEKTASKIRDLKIQLRNDGLHISGQVKFLFFTMPFDTIVDFISTATDIFELRVRKANIAGFNIQFLTGSILEALKIQFDEILKGLCTFQYIGKETDNSLAMRVIIEPQKLIPAFPNLHLLEIDVRDREFLLKMGVP